MKGKSVTCDVDKALVKRRIEGRHSDGAMHTQSFLEQD